MIRALAITGPTASGKTSLSIEIAKALGCEIVCLDSMQIYKKMDIGTAKATAEERRAVPHHMLDFLSPNEPFSAGNYKDMAMECMKDISSRGKIPLLVGGTGLYLSTLIRPDTEEPPKSTPEYRKKYEDLMKTEEGKIAIHERLRQIDRISAEAMHYNNTRRVIRALEIFDATGKPKSYFDALTKEKNEELEVIHVTLDFHNRENLYSRVNLRVEEMLRAGLYEETRTLLDEGYLGENTTAAQAIGYKEIIGVITRGEDPIIAKEALKQATRNYAKRQLTWFRHMEGARTLFCDSEDGQMKSADELFSECLNIFENCIF